MVCLLETVFLLLGFFIFWQNDVCGKNNNYNNNSSGGYCNKSSEVTAAGAGNWPIATLNVGTTTTTN